MALPPEAGHQRALVQHDLGQLQPAHTFHCTSAPQESTATNNTDYEATGFCSVCCLEGTAGDECNEAHKVCIILMQAADSHWQGCRLFTGGRGPDRPGRCLWPAFSGDCNGAGGRPRQPPPLRERRQVSGPQQSRRRNRLWCQVRSLTLPLSRFSSFPGVQSSQQLQNSILMGRSTWFSASVEAMMLLDLPCAHCRQNSLALGCSEGVKSASDDTAVPK